MSEKVQRVTICDACSKELVQVQGECTIGLNPLSFWYSVVQRQNNHYKNFCSLECLHLWVHSSAASSSCDHWPPSAHEDNSKAAEDLFKCGEKK